MVTFSSKTIFMAAGPVELDHSVRDAFESHGHVIVLYDPSAWMQKFGQFPNLIALGPEGQRRWVAELPTTNSGECYERIISREPLIAWTWDSYECEIDITTGRIKKRIFTK